MNSSVFNSIYFPHDPCLFLCLFLCLMMSNVHRYAMPTLSAKDEQSMDPYGPHMDAFSIVAKGNSVSHQTSKPFQDVLGCFKTNSLLELVL